MASQRNDSPYQLPYSDRMSDYISPLPPQMRAYLRPFCDLGRDRGQMRAYLRPFCDPGRDRGQRYHSSLLMGDTCTSKYSEGRDCIPHQQVIIAPAPPGRSAALRNFCPENVESSRPANALPLKVKPTAFSRDLLVSSKKKAEMTDTEAKVKNFFAASVRQAVDLCNLRCMKDTQTYGKVKEMMLYYNPTLDDTQDLKLIKNAVQKHLKYRRRTIRKRNPEMAKGIKGVDEEETKS